MLLLRIALQRRYRYTIFVCIVLLVITNLAMFFLMVFQYQPISYLLGEIRRRRKRNLFTFSTLNCVRIPFHNRRSSNRLCIRSITNFNTIGREDEGSIKDLSHLDSGDRRYVSDFLNSFLRTR